MGWVSGTEAIFLNLDDNDGLLWKEVVRLVGDIR